MEGFRVFFLIFGIMIILYGIIIFYSKNPFIPRMYHKPSKDYKKFVGVTTMMTGLVPIICVLVSFITDSMLCIMLTFVIFLVLAFYLSYKLHNK